MNLAIFIAALLNVVAKAYDFAVNEVAPSISADKKNLNRLNPISETPIAQVLHDLQPQELLFCGACGNVEKAPKRWKPLPGASRGRCVELSSVSLVVW